MAMNGRSEFLRPIWKRNERRVYLANFLHMTMYSMCLGGVFDLFLYSLSQQQEVVLQDPITIGPGAPPAQSINLETHREFVLTFSVLPEINPVLHRRDDCWKTQTCDVTLLQISDLNSNGSCCTVGGRVPALYFSNSTYLSLEMDSADQNDSIGIAEYLTWHKCSDNFPLSEGVWHNIKVTARDMSSSKGQFSTDGGLLLFVDGRKICEVPGARYHRLPSYKNAAVYFGSMHKADLHPSAHAKISNVKYGRPSSNLFVGQVNSMQGVLSVVLMYPIGWMGDKLNRYTFLRVNLLCGVVAGLIIAFAVMTKALPLVFTGVICFTLYQQSISALIYAVLADNVEKAGRTKASTNYKTFSALAMSVAPAMQFLMLLAYPVKDSWTSETLQALLLPGWMMLPLIAIAICTLVPVGTKISSVPNVDELELKEQKFMQRSFSDTWLNQKVLFNQRRRFIVAFSINSFFITTLLANGMTVRYFNLYFTQILHFSPRDICLLNAGCRLFIAAFTQIASPLSRRLGRANAAILLHVASALFTLGIYGGGFFKPSIAVASICYAFRFGCLHTRDPLLYAITVDCVPPEQRSRWAAMNSLRSFSFSASAVLGGYLADQYGYEFSFNITVLSLLGCTFVFLPVLIWFPRQEGKMTVVRDIPSPNTKRPLCRIDSEKLGRECESLLPGSPTKFIKLEN